MKQYTGTKTVKAMPMTMGEAYERKLLKEGVRPSEYETDKAGYLVEYEGGYQSWSPADPFEKAYKPSEIFIERLRIECNELNERYQKLCLFTNMGFNKVAEKVGAKQAALLGMQAMYMQNYLKVLKLRIENIENEKK